MVIFAGQLSVRVEKGAFADEDFRPSSEVDGGLTGLGVDRIGDDVPFADIGHFVETGGLAVDGDLPFLLKLPDERAVDASSFELFLLEFEAVGLGEAPADIFDAMLEEGRFDFKSRAFFNDARL